MRKNVRNVKKNNTRNIVKSIENFQILTNMSTFILLFANKIKKVR